jgi:exodeoxyribonuclease X
MLLRVIDIETTGLAPPAEVIEIGCVDVIINNNSVAIGTPKAQLFRPLNGIPPETMAIHHIAAMRHVRFPFICL